MQLQALCITVAECLAGIHNAKFRGAAFIDSINYRSEFTGLGVGFSMLRIASGKQDKGMLFGFTEECAGAVVHWLTANDLSALGTKPPRLRTLA
jgi:hypothetical protein